MEGSGHPINMVTDHKNLEYFTSMKNSHVSKHDGQSIFPSSTFESISAQGDWVPSQMHLPITWMYTPDPDQTPHLPMSIHCSHHSSWRPPHPMPVDWITLLEDSWKHWTSSES